MNARKRKKGDFATDETHRIYRVVMDGTVQVGADREFVVNKLSRLFGTDREVVEALLNGEPQVIKKNLSARRAHQYFRTIMNAGAVCHLEDSVISGASPSAGDASISSYSISTETETESATTTQKKRHTTPLADEELLKTGEYRLHHNQDKIIYLLMAFLVFGLLAVIYLII